MSNMSNMTNSCDAQPDDDRSQTLVIEPHATPGSGTATATAPAPLRFTVMDELGRGGMGAVYRARDEDLGREVAVKVARGAVDPERAARFLAEARITGQLQHPNIVPVHGCGIDTGGRPWFSMTLVHGRELSEIIARRAEDPVMAQEWPLSRLVAVLVQACNGVAFAHSRGVVHRDLKPANMMLGGFGEVLVMDWGLGCRSVTPGTDEGSWAGAPSLTRDGTIAGTPSYMPPEQARGERDRIGPRSDVYALGSVLFEFLTGHPPHRGDTAEEVVRQAQVGTIVWPARHLQGAAIPRDLAAVAGRALQYETGARYPSVEAFRDDLQRWLDRRPVEAAASGWWGAFGKLIQRHRVSSAVIGVALCAVLMSLAATVVVSMRERSRTEFAVATADAERERAERGRKREMTINAGAERHSRESARGLAIALMAQADALVARGRLPAAAHLLDSVPTDQREWVWRHLRLTASGRGESAAAVASGTQLLAAPVGFAVSEPHGALHWIGLDGAIVRTLDLGRPVQAVGSDGEHLAVAFVGGNVRIVNAEDGRILSEHLGLGTVMRCVPLNETSVLVGDGHTVSRIGGEPTSWPGSVFMALGGNLAICDGASISMLGSGPIRNVGGTVVALGVSRDGRCVAAATATMVRWWSPEIPAGSVLPAPGIGVVAPRHDLVVVADGDGTVTWWDPGLGVPVLRRSLPGRGIPTLAWSSDSSAVAACAADGTVRIWRQ